MEEGELFEELDLAVRIVHLACTLCQNDSLITVGGDVAVEEAERGKRVADAAVYEVLLLMWRRERSYCSYCRQGL